MSADAIGTFTYHAPLYLTTLSVALTLVVLFISSTVLEDFSPVLGSLNDMVPAIISTSALFLSLLSGIVLNFCPLYLISFSLKLFFAAWRSDEVMRLTFSGRIEFRKAFQL